jgi:carotenoid cleavage dioxygenase
MARGAPTATVRWLDVAPCYVFHVLNAYDDTDGSMVLDVVRYPKLWARGTSDVSPGRLHRWRIDLGAGRVSEQPLDDRSVEFPRCDERRTGLANRYGYAIDTERSAIDATGTSLVKYDLRTGTAVAHDFGPGRIPSEPVFAPASATATEDEGWVMAYVYDAARDGSDFVILDAREFTAKPVATIALPQRVPFGFHGSWIPDA